MTREASKPHISPEAARPKIAKMRELDEYGGGGYWGRQADFWEGLVEQLQTAERDIHDLTRRMDLEITARMEAVEQLRAYEKYGEERATAYKRLHEHLEALDQWSRDVLPQLSRLIDIIEGRHEEARLIPPHGQSSATPHALLDRWRSLHSNPASAPVVCEATPTMSGAFGEGNEPGTGAGESSPAISPTDDMDPRIMGNQIPPGERGPAKERQ